MRLQNLGIARKLWLGVIFLIAANVVIVGFAGVRTAKLTASFDAAFAQLDTKLAAAQDWASRSEAEANRAAVLGHTPGAIDPLAAAREQNQAQLVTLRQQLDGLPLDEADRAQLARIDAAQAQFTQALAHPEQIEPALKAYTEALREFSAMQPRAATALRHQFGEARRGTVLIAGVMALAVMGTMVLSAALLIRAIRRPLNTAVAAAAQMAAGDLRVHVSSQASDEIGQLLNSLGTLSSSLNRLVGDVRLTTDSIYTASNEIAVGNQDLSNRTEQTAADLEETASSMIELTGNVHESANAAQQAHALVEQASATARRGGEVMDRVVNNMDGIAQASRKIGDIIGVIDGIAFQTNILALNAAVEAARAGEQGRGFAVVAGEVRTLAQRSAEAAREIKSLIGASVTQVESGTQLVQDAGKTMQEIVNDVVRVSSVISEISAAAAEQSSSIGQINQAVSHLDQMTQQNAALVEESTAAAASLTEQAHRLSSAINAFQTDAQRG
ncbi:MAG: HAMP domain-containing protein [Aquabacterium sp.]|nr:MAG: HAMP domain-containing protein [Aquabacterium sp.]